MNVLMFGWEYPPHNSGGLGVACQGLANALADKNVDLTFVLPKRLNVQGSKFRFRFANIPNVDINIIELDSLLVPYITSEKYSHLIRSGLDPHGNYGSTLFEEVKRYALLARGIAKREKFDIVHAHDWLTYGAGHAAKEVSHRPLVAHIHATEVDRTAGNPNKFIYDAEKRGFENADKILSVSDFTKKVVHDKYFIDNGKIEVVHNGIDATQYDTEVTSDEGVSELKKLGYKIVLAYGRITIMKGFDHLVNAANLVIKHRPKTLFVIVGSGDMEGQIMKQAADLGISNNVLFPGFLRGRELSSMIRAADLFVMPSVSEPFGLTSLESLLHGTPAIVSKQSGVSEVLKNVLKVDFWDVEDMADKILSVLSHNSLKKELSNNGRMDASHCTWDAAADKCIDVYKSLL